MPTKKRPTQNLDRPIKSRKTKCNHHPCGNCWIFGSALAMILSYERSTSILYAILHGALSWFYIIFRAMQVWGWF